MFKNPDDSHDHSRGVLDMLYQYDSFLDSIKVVADMGQTPRLLTPAEVYTNDLIAGANNFDHAAVAKDAKAFKLTPVFAKVAIK